MNELTLEPTELTAGMADLSGNSEDPGSLYSDTFKAHDVSDNISTSDTGRKSAIPNASRDSFSPGAVYRPNITTTATKKTPGVEESALEDVDIEELLALLI